jgi:integrase
VAPAGKGKIMELATTEIIAQPVELVVRSHSRNQNAWVTIFDPLRAIRQVFNHIEKQPSSRSTRHTARQYRMCLYDYLEFCGAVILLDQSDKTRMDGDSFDFSQMTLHTPEQMEEYIRQSIEQKKRSSLTIKKYLAPIRVYLKALKQQSFVGLEGPARYLILDAKEMFEIAADVAAPVAETKSTESAGQRGIRMNLSQVKEYTGAINRDTIAGKRDAAIFHLGLVSMLRVSEIARIRLCDIRPGKKSPWEIVVMGKRNNVDPVGFDQKGYHLIMDYVEAYNAGLDFDDPRRITKTSALWQPLRSDDRYFNLGANRYDPNIGMRENAIRRMLMKRTPEIVCEQIGKKDGIRPHDLRRTTALGLAERNVPISAIQRQARHSNAQTTSNYIGQFTDLSIGLITNHWSIWNE